MDILEQIDLVLNEIFDTNIPVKLIAFDRYDRVIYNFKIVDRMYNFIANFKDSNIGGGFWNIEFGLSDAHSYKSKYGITGEGNSIKVFSAVAKCFGKFVHKVNPDIICFTADEKNRVKLYDRFIKLIVKKFPYKISNDKQINDYILAGSLEKNYILIKKGVVTIYDEYNKTNRNGIE